MIFRPSCALRRVQITRLGSTLQANKPAQPAKDEISVTIPSIPAEEIYSPFPNISLDQWKPELCRTENVGKSYFLQENVLAKLDQFLMPPNLRRELYMTKRPSLLYRSSIHNLIESVEEARETKLKTPIVLDGKRGTGKSAALVFSTCHFIEKKWLVLPLVSISKIVRGYYPFVYNKSTETFDQPEAAQDLIANFQSLNPGLKDHKDLAGIVEAGVKSTDNSTSSLKKLLSALSQLQSVPVLVVVDGVNGLFMEETSYKDSNSCPVPAQKLSILRDLSSLFTGETVMNNGVFLGAFDNHSYGVDNMPSGISTRKLEWNNYSREETRQMLFHYSKSGFVTKDEITDPFVQKSYFLTGGNGRELHKFCEQRHLY